MIEYYWTEIDGKLVEKGSQKLTKLYNNYENYLTLSDGEPIIKNFYYKSCSYTRIKKVLSFTIKSRMYEYNFDTNKWSYHQYTLVNSERFEMPHKDVFYILKENKRLYNRIVFYYGLEEIEYISKLGD